MGQLGLLERENAAILNAALLPLARRVLVQCEQAVRGTGITAPLFLTANDGTLMSVEDARRVRCAARCECGRQALHLWRECLY